MMTHAPLAWQSEQWLQLNKQLEQDRLPHALMLSGPAEIGKRQFALSFARFLLCHAPVDGTACTRCKACLLFDASTHPDFMFVEPEAEGKAIKVDQIRALGEFAAKTAALGGHRVIVVNPAEAMNINAANAFLKTLEEPSQGLVLMLVAHQPARILPTIRSRCRILPFALPHRENVTQWLSTQTGDIADIEQVLALSGGRPFRALRMLDSELREQLDAFQKTIAGVEKRAISPLDAAKVLQALRKEDVLEWFQYRVYANIRSVAGVQNRSEQLLFRFMDRLTTVRQRLLSTANPNPQLIWEEVLMDWKSVIDLTA